MEEWKDIIGFEGLYKISSLGKVWSETKNIILSPVKDKDGYYQIGLSKNRKRTFHKIHRLVAQAFIKNPKQLSVVNHKNENKTDNTPENLEWCTQSYNNAYGSKVKSVIQVSLSGVILKKYRSITEASKINRCDKSGIAGCCRGRRDTAGGYKWEYDRPVI